MATRLICPTCGESFFSDSIDVACPNCGEIRVRSAPGERFSERAPSGLVLAEALNESLKRLKATQSPAGETRTRKPR